MIVEKMTIAVRSLIGEKSTIVLCTIRVRSQRLGGGRASGVPAMINKNNNNNIQTFILNVLGRVDGVRLHK